jgi:4-hydroxyphenylacetate 3-monooxygenase
MVNTDKFTHVQDMIGEITTYIELTRGAIVASEADAKPNSEGVLFPEVRYLFAIRNSGNRWYPRVREILQLILAGGLLYQPASVEAFDSPVRKDIEKFYRGPQVSAEERVKIFKVAADLAVSSFGGRHELYERFYAGDPMFLRINTQYHLYNWEEPLRLVDEFLRSYSAREVLEEMRLRALGEM